MVALAIVIAGCSADSASAKRTRPVLDGSNNPFKEHEQRKREERFDAEELYRRARTALDASDFFGALENYDKLSTRFPFSDFATQGELERVYALYRNGEFDRAISSADRFLREHPRHPDVDYLYYIKGLSNFVRDDTTIRMLRSDESKSDITSQRRAYDDFSLLIQRFPNSRYNGDAYARMIFIRNRVAAHELHVVDFYISRGAYVAAAKRAEQVIAQYPGAPSARRALDLLVQCYELAGLDQQAADARALRAGQETGVGSAGAASGTTAAAPDAAKPGLLERIAGIFSSSDPASEEKQIAMPPAGQPTGTSSTAAPPTGAMPAATPEPQTSATAGSATGDKSAGKSDTFFEPYDQADPAKDAAAPRPEPAPAAP
ncbi:MAG: outer membrane protein assembly factor BamD [Panacagrimonas sp.]